MLRQVLATNVVAAASNATLSPRMQLKADLKQFQTNAVSLSPSDAATQWLKLIDRFAEVSAGAMSFYSGPRSNEEPLQAEDLLAALPPPKAWSELVKQVEQRPAAEGADQLRQLGLRLLVHTLVNDTARRREDLAAMRTFASKAKSNQLNSLNSAFQQLQRLMLGIVDNPDAIIPALEQEVAAHNGQEYWNNLEVPDLVALVGREKAEAFLRKALVQFNGPVQVREGTETQKLAQRLALELIDQLKKPQWYLANSLDAGELYEAMDKRFSTPQPPAAATPVSDLPVLPADMPGQADYQKQSARVYYFLGLIAKGNVSNAVVVAKQFEREGNIYFPDEVIRQMERAGFTRELNNFFHEQLAQNPELPFWDEYVTVAAHAEQTEEMVKLVRETIAKKGVSKAQQYRLRQTLCNALLADGQMEEGVTELRNLLHSTNAPSSRNSYGRGSSFLALQLAQIGQLLKRTNWMEEGIAAAKVEVLRGDDENNYWSDPSAIALATFLRENDRGPEAEKVLADAMSQKLKKLRNPEVTRWQGYATGPQFLYNLAFLYHEAGRPKDVLALFDEAPFWGAKDLADSSSLGGAIDYSSSDYYNKHVATPVGYFAAAALADTGRKAEARKILDSLFEQSPGCDRLYELLLKLDDEQAPATLDSIFARDQFEERPLIWKAHWLRIHGKLEEAEKTARAAISIDPTDGEEGPGDRLRAYAELAEIRAARGDAKEAATLHGAVEAVHEAELADQFHAAGLLKRAVELYTDSLNKFADAYCIHARLAVQLSALGLHDEAAEHYRRAYELMPDSFGRVESHCFGCERTFDGERAQGIAEKVFTKLVEKTPDKPQVHYMFGYLREEQSRFQEALESYRKAVKLDPDYLNAWAKMESIASHVFLAPGERDSIVFNILRLDPLQHRQQPSFELVSDLPTLWNQIAEIENKRPVPPATLYPLRASAAELEKRNNASGEGIEEYRHQYYDRSSVEVLKPWRAVSQNGFVRAAFSLFANESVGYDTD